MTALSGMLAECSDAGERRSRVRVQQMSFFQQQKNSTVFMLLKIVKAVGWEVSRRICWQPPLSNRRTEFESGHMHWCIM